jgi:hypothetical protein
VARPRLKAPIRVQPSESCVHGGRATEKAERHFEAQPAKTKIREPVAARPEDPAQSSQPEFRQPLTENVLMTIQPTVGVISHVNTNT